MLAACFGLLFVVFTPPGQSADDAEHFFRAYQVATGGWVASRENNLVGGPLPEDLAVIAKLIPRGINGRRQNPADILKIVHFDRSPAQSGQTMFIGFPNMAKNIPLLYLPQALGITFGKALDASPIALNYLARFGNLLVWIAVVFTAIKTIPMAKWLLLAVALTPMSLFLATSMSADTMTYGLCFLFIALVMKLAFGRPAVTMQSLLLLLTLCALVALSKVVYVVLIFLVLLIPRSKFTSNRRYLAFMGLCFGLGIGMALSWSAVVINLHVPANPGQTADPSAQIAFILSEPLRYLAIFASAVFNGFSELARQLIGVLGWLDTRLPSWFYLASYAAIGLISLFDQTAEVELNVLSKLIILAVFSAGTLLVFTGLYINWTPVGGTVILGVQGRYFIPLSLLFWLSFYRLTGFDKRIPRRCVGLFVVVFYSAMLSYVSWLLLHRYYVF